MILRFIILCLVGGAATVPMSAQIVMRLYAKNYVYGREVLSGNFPHAFVSYSGTKLDGTVVNEAWGFNPASSDPNVGAWDYVVEIITGGPGEVKDEMDLLSRSTAYLEVPISDTKFTAMQQTRAQWNSKESLYQPTVRNCIDFVNEIAGQGGLIVPTSTVLDPVQYLTGLAMLNPQYIAGSVHTIEELEKFVNGTGSRGSGAYNSTTSTTNYGQAIDTQWLNAEYYRRKRAALAQSTREVSRSSVAVRHSSDNYKKAVAQATVNKTQAAAVQATIDKFENSIRNASSPTVGVEGTWGSGSSGSSSGAGGTPGGPSGTPPPGECYFIQCLTTEQPRFYKASVRARSRNATRRVLSQLSTGTAVDSRDSPVLAFEMNGVAAPVSSRQVIHLGNVRPGQRRSATVDIAIVGSEMGQFAIFSSGAVTFSMKSEDGVPSNVFSLRKGYSPNHIEITTTVPTTPVKAGEELPADRLWIMQGGAIVAEVYLTYDVFIVDAFSATLDSGRLASGFGTNWGPEYFLCTGLSPLGFTLDKVTYSLRTFSTDFERTCTSGWATCTPFDGAGEEGRCVKFQAQGHERKNRPFSKHVGIWGLDLEASLTVVFRLADVKPRWVMPTEIEPTS